MECTQRRHSKTVTGFNDEGQKGQIKLNQDKLQFYNFLKSITEVQAKRKSDQSTCEKSRPDSLAASSSEL